MTLELLITAINSDDAPTVHKILSQNPHLKSHINNPLLPFDSPPILSVRSRAMLDVLLDAGADINAKSRWWAGPFHILDTINPSLAPYAIERGAAISIHSA